MKKVIGVLAVLFCSVLVVFAADNYVTSGNIIYWLNGTGSDVDSGAVVDIGDMYGVTLGDVTNGGSGNVQWQGVFRFPIFATNIFTVGEAAYYVSTNATVSDTYASDTYLGICYEASSGATGSTEYVNILLNAPQRQIGTSGSLVATSTATVVGGIITVLDQ